MAVSRSSACVLAGSSSAPLTLIAKVRLAPHRCRLSDSVPAHATMLHDHRDSTQTAHTTSSTCSPTRPAVHAVPRNQPRPLVLYILLTSVICC